MSGWYYRTAGKPAIGPVSAGELRVLAEQGSITSDSQVSNEQITHGEWVSANRIKELKSKFNAIVVSQPAIASAEIVGTSPPVPIPARQPQGKPAVKSPLERIIAACAIGSVVFGIITACGVVLAVLCAGIGGRNKPSSTSRHIPTSSTSRSSANGVPTWYDSTYSVTDLDGWRTLSQNHRRSFCSDCIAKAGGTIDIDKADAFEREITDCSKVGGVGNQDVRELVAMMWVLDQKGGDITSMDDILSDLVRLGR